MDFIHELNKSISTRLDSVTYTQKTRTWQVSKILTINWKEVLPEPPTNTSEETKKELSYLQDITNNLTSQEKNLIYLVDKEPLELYNPIFDKIGDPLPYKKFKKIWRIIDPVVMNLKHKYNRPRPKQLGDLLNYNINVTETKTHNTPAYPSGHTAYAAMGAYLFADMYPQYSSEFFKMIGMAGLARCLQGVQNLIGVKNAYSIQKKR
jgi:hypothetical protein